MLGQVETIDKAIKAFQETAQTHGMLVAVLCGLVVVLLIVVFIGVPWAIRRMYQAFEPVITRVIDTHISTVNKLSETAQQQADDLSEVKELLQTQNAVDLEQAKRMDRMVQGAEKEAAALQSISGSQEVIKSELKEQTRSLEAIRSSTAETSKMAAEAAKLAADAAKVSAENGCKYEGDPPEGKRRR